MNKRVIYGWSLFFLSVGAFLAGGLVWAIVLATLSVLGGNEYINIMRAKGTRPSARIIRGMIISFFVLGCVENIVRHFPGEAAFSLPPNFAINHYPILLTTGVFISFFRLLFRNEQPPATAADIATTILGFIYLGWLPGHFLVLRNLHAIGMAQPTNPLQQPGLAYVWAALFGIYATDVFAYYVGKNFGKHLLYPAVSPKKTVEGAIGGFVAAIFWTTLVVWLSDAYLFPNHPFQGKLWQAPLMGAVVSIAAQLGDLCESLLKRDAGLKDSGNIIPGHGGILDRGDGMIFGAAVSYYWVSMVVLGIW